MQAQTTYAGGTNRGNGSASVRDRAYAEGLQRLSGRTSLAGHLTARQIDAIANDARFELFDASHSVLQAK